MEFPFKPFNFQYAGVAFLFPRHSAILADEMGLGKTMQAITAIRMLLRTGHLKNILLICPKPLVTNWQREFQTWAPEVTVAAITAHDVVELIVDLRSDEPGDGAEDVPRGVP